MYVDINMGGKKFEFYCKLTITTPQHTPMTKTNSMNVGEMFRVTMMSDDGDGVDDSSIVEELSK